MTPRHLPRPPSPDLCTNIPVSAVPFVKSAAMVDAGPGHALQAVQAVPLAVELAAGCCWTLLLVDCPPGLRASPTACAGRMAGLQRRTC